MKTIQVSEDALNTLKAMAEQDAKDAARWRFIRTRIGYNNTWDSVSLPCGNGEIDADETDAAIDSAMQTK